MEKEIKETDPNYKDSSPVRAKDAPDQIVPNPFVLDQAHALPKWSAYLQTLTQQEGSYKSLWSVGGREMKVLKLSDITGPFAISDSFPLIDEDNT